MSPELGAPLAVAVPVEGYGPPIGAPLSLIEAGAGGAEQQGADRAYEWLAGLPAEGFRSEAEHQALIGDIVAIGLPVDNYRQLAYAPNDRAAGTHNHLGSWGIAGEEQGRFSVFELIDNIPEERLPTEVHEGAHANTPLRPGNAYLFGGEAKRAEAALYAENLAGQSLITRRYLNGYHAYNARLLDRGEMSVDRFVEETQAIATELGMTNRAKLEQVQAAQHAEVARLQQRGLWDPAKPPVNLLSAEAPDGHIEVDGIDRQLITLTRGVSDYSDLLEHVGQLKERFYSPRNVQIVNRRREVQLADTPVQWIIAMNRRLLESQAALTDDSDASEEDKDGDTGKTPRAAKRQAASLRKGLSGLYWE